MNISTNFLALGSWLAAGAGEEEENQKENLVEENPPSRRCRLKDRRKKAGAGGGEQDLLWAAPKGLTIAGLLLSLSLSFLFLTRFLKKKKNVEGRSQAKPS